MTFTNIKNIFIAACLFLIFNNTLSAQGKLIIIGGGKRPAAIINSLISESGVDKKGYIVILPMASEEQDSSIFYAKKQFLNAGIAHVNGFIINKGEQVSKSVVDSIANATLIYIGGGDQVRFMEIVANTPVEKAIKDCYAKGNVVSGTSAGAAVMSAKMITGVELNHKSTTENTESKGFETIEANNIETGKGLGFLTKTIIDQHFVKRKRYNRLIALALENINTVCVGIDEATAIVVKDGKATVIGDSQVIVIKNSNKFIASKANKLGGKGLRLDVWVSGDQFKIK